METAAYETQVAERLALERFLRFHRRTYHERGPLVGPKTRLSAYGIHPTLENPAFVLSLVD